MVPQKDGLDTQTSSGAWTRPNAYLQALATKRSLRRARREPQRSQPERPRLMLSTLPIAVLLILLAVLAAAIMVLAFPGNQPQQRAPKPQPREQGVAPRGWFEEAQKEMHR